MFVPQEKIDGFKWEAFCYYKQQNPIVYVRLQSLYEFMIEQYVNVENNPRYKKLNTKRKYEKFLHKDCLAKNRIIKNYENINNKANKQQKHYNAALPLYNEEDVLEAFECLNLINQYFNFPDQRRYKIDLHDYEDKYKNQIPVLINDANDVIINNGVNISNDNINETAEMIIEKVDDKINQAVKDMTIATVICANEEMKDNDRKADEIKKQITYLDKSITNTCEDLTNVISNTENVIKDSLNDKTNELKEQIGISTRELKENESFKTEELRKQVIEIKQDLKGVSERTNDFRESLKDLANEKESREKTQKLWNLAAIVIVCMIVLAIIGVGIHYYNKYNEAKIHKNDIYVEELEKYIPKSSLLGEFIEKWESIEIPIYTEMNGLTLQCNYTLSEITGLAISVTDGQMFEMTWLRDNYVRYFEPGHTDEYLLAFYFGTDGQMLKIRSLDPNSKDIDKFTEEELNGLMLCAINFTNAVFERIGLKYIDYFQKDLYTLTQAR